MYTGEDLHQMSHEEMDSDKGPTTPMARYSGVGYEYTPETIKKSGSIVKVENKAEALKYLEDNPEDVALFFLPHPNAQLTIKPLSRIINVVGDHGNNIEKPLIAIFEKEIADVIAYATRADIDLDKIRNFRG